MDSKRLPNGTQATEVTSSPATPTHPTPLRRQPVRQVHGHEVSNAHNDVLHEVGVTLNHALLSESRGDGHHGDDLGPRHACAKRGLQDGGQRAPHKLRRSHRHGDAPRDVAIDARVQPLQLLSCSEESIKYLFINSVLNVVKVGFVFVFLSQWPICKFKNTKL